VKLGPNKRSPVELKDQLVQAYREYPLAKKQVTEQLISKAEAKTKLWIVGLLLGIIAFAWVLPSFGPTIHTNSDFGLSSIIGIFFLSYFAFFLSSKVVLKPSVEEVADDTSYIALFSANPQRSLRGWVAAMFGAIHTAALIAYYVSVRTSD
jgi:hypothetical protein